MPTFERLVVVFKRLLLALGAVAILPLLLIRQLISDLRMKAGFSARAWGLTKAVPRIAYLTAFWVAVLYGLVFGFARIIFSH